MSDPSVREIRLAVANEVHPGTVPALPAVGSGEATLTAEDGVMAWSTGASGGGPLTISGTETGDHAVVVYDFITATETTAGLYELSVTAFGTPDTDTGQVLVVVKKNGTEIFGTSVHGASEGGPIGRGFDCMIVALADGDELTVEVTADSFTGVYEAVWGLVATALEAAP